MKESSGQQFTSSEIWQFEHSRKNAIKILLEGGAVYRKGRTQLEVTDEQILKAHREMDREFRDRKKIVNRLKNAQPGEARFESFMHMTALYNSDRYLGRSANTIKYADVNETIKKLKEQDDNYSREYDKNYRVTWDYSGKLSHKSGSTDMYNRLFAKALKEIRDQKIAEIRRERRQAQTQKIK